MKVARSSFWLSHTSSTTVSFTAYVYRTYGCSCNRQNGDVTNAICQYMYNVTWASWRLRSPATRLFVQPFGLLRKKTSKAEWLALFLGGSTGYQWIPSQRVSNVKRVSTPWRHPYLPPHLSRCSPQVWRLFSSPPQATHWGLHGIRCFTRSCCLLIIRSVVDSN